MTMLSEVFKAFVWNGLLYLNHFKWTFQTLYVVSNLSVHLSFICPAEQKVVVLDTVGKHIEQSPALEKGGVQHIWVLMSPALEKGAEHHIWGPPSWCAAHQLLKVSE